MAEASIDVVVVGRVDEADGVVALILESADRAPLPEWTPGAHVDIHVPGDKVRQYSLSSRPEVTNQWRLGVLREIDGRGGSAWIHDRVVVGTALRVSAPRNNFALHEAARYRFIAGGIGITPLLPMIAEVERTGAPWQLLYGGRSRKSMAFLTELEAYGNRVMVRPQDEAGLLDLAAFLSDPQPGERIYACGPEPMLVATEAAAQESPWPAHSLHMERFVPKAITLQDDEVFDVDFVDSGLSGRVDPRVSILDVAESLGLNVFSSCREGTCGTCETDILEGEVEHRDSLLTASEQATNKSMMICVSRAAHGCAKLKLAL